MQRPHLTTIPRLRLKPKLLADRRARSGCDPEGGMSAGLGARHSAGKARHHQPEHPLPELQKSAADAL